MSGGVAGSSRPDQIFRKETMLVSFFCSLRLLGRDEGDAVTMYVCVCVWLFDVLFMVGAGEVRLDAKAGITILAARTGEIRVSFLSSSSGAVDTARVPSGGLWGVARRASAAGVPPRRSYPASGELGHRECGAGPADYTNVINVVYVLARDYVTRNNITTETVGNRPLWFCGAVMGRGR
ncbi:hypothetical protein GWI33_014987 [Rhynchophorus ferrugineus]|uniref:Uncharacterized protein n=1 Tax=Rhynchophorus ferrugineus TaxID=354439 RepID=A0A834I452_RHYFE|nr:hypothetical protein GWI33_014987 [Rhynchophorus ferrugineus]